jgi:hypothetical protein
VAYTESETSGSQGDYREKVDTYTRTEFPSTLASDWCGEYQTNASMEQPRAEKDV